MLDLKSIRILASIFFKGCLKASRCCLLFIRWIAANSSWLLSSVVFNFGANLSNSCNTFVIPSDGVITVGSSFLIGVGGVLGTTGLFPDAFLPLRLINWFGDSVLKAKNSSFPNYSRYSSEWNLAATTRLSWNIVLLFAFGIIFDRFFGS